MAFPSTPILDDFNRSNEGPPPSSNWTSIYNGHVVASNHIRGYVYNDNNVSMWNASTFGPNIEAYAARKNEYTSLGVIGRLDASSNGYWADFSEWSGYITIWRLDGGYATQ
jgi:hypothetical protein